MRTALRLPLEVAAVFAGCTAVFYWMLTQRAALFDIDALFHYKVARLILERGPWVDISWLPFTVLGEHGPDHHWLFHALLAPLTVLGNDAHSVALASALAGAAIPAALLPFLRRAGVPLAILFSLAVMFSSELLPGRFLALRAQNLALVLMVAALFALAARRTAWIGVIAFLFMQAYHGAVILAVLVFVTMAAQWPRDRSVSLRPLAAVLVGVLAGLVASPWFPENVGYLVFHTFFKAATGVPGLVGSEWLPVPVALMASESWPAHAVLVSGAAALIATRPRGEWPRAAEITLAFLAATLVFLALYHFAWRFVEYYAPFAVISGGLLWRDALRERPLRRPIQASLGVLLAALIAWGAYHGSVRMREAMRYPFDAYADMMRHVDAHDPHPMVFNARWSDFQQMVFWSERARFVAGLDGHYLLYGDPKRFKAWYEISTGQAANRDDNARAIREAFGAGWAVVPRDKPEIARSLARDAGAHLALETRDGWLFRLD